MFSLKAFWSGMFACVLINTSMAQLNSQENIKLKKVLTEKVDQEIDRVYKTSVEKTNIELKNGSNLKFKEGILSSLNNDEDKKYIEQLFSSFKADTFKKINLSYKNGIIWVKAFDNIVVKIKPIGAFNTKFSVNENEVNLENYNSLKDALENINKFAEVNLENKTVYQYLKSVLLIDDSFANFGITAAIAVVIYYELFLAVPSDVQLQRDCSQRVKSVMDETTRLLKSCEEQLDQLNNFEWSHTTAGKILASSKSLPFAIKAKNSDDVTCEKFEANAPNLTGRTAISFFTHKISCFEKNGRAQFCDTVQKLQSCVAKSVANNLTNGNSVSNGSRGSKLQNSAISPASKMAPNNLQK